MLNYIYIIIKGLFGTIVGLLFGHFLVSLVDYNAIGPHVLIMISLIPLVFFVVYVLGPIETNLSRKYLTNNANSSSKRVDVSTISFSYSFIFFSLISAKHLMNVNEGLHCLLPIWCDGPFCLLSYCF